MNNEDKTTKVTEAVKQAGLSSGQSSQSCCALPVSFQSSAPQFSAPQFSAPQFSAPQFSLPQSSSSNSNLLNKADELLVMRFVDGECRFFEGWKARRLLSRSEAAKNCAARFVENSALCKQSLKSFAPFISTSNLADRVDRRIVEEGRLAVILGERRLESHPSRKWSIGSIVSGVVRGSGSWAELDARYALAGSLVAVVVFAGVLGPKFIAGMGSGLLNTSEVAEVRENSSLQLALARGSSAANEGPGIRLSQDQIPQATSVNWVRGGGRIELVRSPEDDSSNTPIIWIKRRNDTSLAHSARGLRERQVGLSDAYAISHGR